MWSTPEVGIKLITEALAPVPAENHFAGAGRGDTGRVFVQENVHHAEANENQWRKPHDEIHRFARLRRHQSSCLRLDRLRRD
jgi:hypothetical protein